MYPLSYPWFDNFEGMQIPIYENHRAKMYIHIKDVCACINHRAEKRQHQSEAWKMAM
jgi:hypothetical protein